MNIRRQVAAAVAVLAVCCIHGAACSNGCEDYVASIAGGCDTAIPGTGDGNVPLRTCVGVVGCIMTIPCGDHTPSSNGTATYTLATAHSQLTSFIVDTFLSLNITLSHHKGRIICTVDQQILGEYVLNIISAPYEVELQSVPDPISGRGLSVDCPIRGNPAPVVQWTRYSDIDQAYVLPWPSEIEFRDQLNSSWVVDKWSSEFNGFYICCGANILNETCYHNTITFRLFSEECDIPEIAETGLITLVGGGKGEELDVGQSVTLRCIFVGAYMDQPPSWWYQEETGGDYQRITSFTIGFKINAIFDDSRCAWRSDLTIGRFELDSAGVYSCYRGTTSQSLALDTQACYKNSVGGATISVTGGGEGKPKGTNVTLTCILMDSTQLLSPRWCRLSDNGTCQEEGRGNTTFSSITCQWTNTLTLYNLSRELEGNYRCYVPNTTLSTATVVAMQDESIFPLVMDTTSIAVSVTIGLVAVVIIAFGASAVIIHWYRVAPFKKTREPPHDGFDWDVFVSYHSEAEDFATHHVKRPLENNDYTVCWHHDHFLPGRTISDNINTAVENSRKVVLVLSNNFTASNHCMMELSRSLERLQTTRIRCIVPIAIDTGGVPTELKSLVTYWPVVEVDKNFYENLMKTIGPPMATSSLSMATVSMATLS